MPRAGASSVSSATTPITVTDADAVPTEKLPEASSCATSLPEKTPGLSLEDNQDHDDGFPAPATPPSTAASQNDHERGEKNRADFYRQYSAYWHFGNGAEYARDYSRTSWAAHPDQASSSCPNPRGDDDTSDWEQGREDSVEPTCTMASWAGQPDIKGRNETVRMMLLCAVHFGITFTWGVEMTCEWPCSCSAAGSRTDN